MPPPAAVADASARWHHEQRGSEVSQPCLDVEALVRFARQSPMVAALNIGQSKLSRLIRSALRAGVDQQNLIGWVIAYADPTGETAVRNVMKGRGW